MAYSLQSATLLSKLISVIREHFCSFFVPELVTRLEEKREVIRSTRQSLRNSPPFAHRPPKSARPAGSPFKMLWNKRAASLHMPCALLASQPRLGSARRPLPLPQGSRSQPRGDQPCSCLGALPADALPASPSASLRRGLCLSLARRCSSGRKGGGRGHLRWVLLPGPGRRWQVGRSRSTGEAALQRRQRTVPGHIRPFLCGKQAGSSPRTTLQPPQPGSRRIFPLLPP